MIASTDMELSFAAYNERQHHEISPDGLRNRAARVAPGGRALYENGEWEPQPYPGHAVVTMVSDLSQNDDLTAELEVVQRELSTGFGDPTAIYMLPQSSFHQTIANTLSDEKHQKLVVERGRASTFPRLVTDAFPEIPAMPAFAPMSMRMVGLGIFSTAIGVLGVFDSEEAFQRVLHFRDHFYRHSRIELLGIRRTRPFIGHVTVAYVERLLENDERHRLADTVAAINRSLAGRDLRFHLQTAELRAYDHLAEFKPIPGLPVYRL